MTKIDNDSKCLEMAVALGNAVRESDASIRMADAAAAYSKNPQDPLRIKEYQHAAKEYDDFAESVIQLLEITIFGMARAKNCGGGCCSGGRG